MRDVALALFVFGTIPFILMRPYVGLLVWSWLGYMSPNRLTYGFAFNFPWVQIIAITTLVALFVSKENKRIPVSSVSVLLFLFLAWTAVTTIFAAVPASAWDQWIRFAKILAMVFVTLMLVNSRERVHWLVWTIVVSLGFYGFKGGVFTVLSGGRYHALGPADTFIADNNAFALALCMTLPLMRYLQLQARNKYVRLGLGAGMLLTGITVLGTYSRGGLLGLAAVAGVLLIRSRKRMTIAVVVLVLGFIGYHFMPAQWTARMGTLQDPTQQASAESRIQSWKFAANVAFHRPLTGGGFNDYQSKSLWETYAPEGAKERAVHSIYFRVLGEQGFPGLLLFLGLLAAAYRSCRRVRLATHGDEDRKWAYDLASMLQATLVAYAVAGAFLPMAYFDLTYQLFALCALVEGVVGQAPSKAQPAGEPAPGRDERRLAYAPAPGRVGVLR